MVSLRELALYAALLNKAKKTIRKKKPALIDIHQATLDQARKIFEEHVRMDMSLEDIVIESFSLGEESDQYSLQFLESYLGSQQQKVKRDPIYISLDNLSVVFANQVANQSANEVSKTY